MMESWIAGQVAFLFTFYKVRPASIVDKFIEIALDVLVPPSKSGDNWFRRNWKSLEKRAERKSRELEIRSNLRQWDEQYPGLHHELLVRYTASFLASALVSSLAHTLKNAVYGSSSRRY